MIFALLKFFVCAFGIGFAWAFVICLFAVCTEKLDRDKRLREEGYDTCVYDILHFGEYYDREQQKYVKLTDSQEKQSL